MSEWRRWLAVGTGVGIEIRGGDLEVTVARARPRGASIVAATTIAGFLERPAAEWGADYGIFLRKAGAAHVAAAVLLPRREVTVRHLDLAGVAAQDLAAAIGYQVDGMHPYADTEAVHGWARLRAGPGVLIAITRQEVVERYLTLFAEAGARVGSFTVSAAALYSALRLYGEPPASLLACLPDGDNVEVYGESPARPVFSSLIEAGARAWAQAASELRLPAETEAVAIHERMPKPLSAPAGWDGWRQSLAYAAALGSACPRLALGLNLLPKDRRSASSRAALAPTAALAGLLAAAGIALAAYDGVEDRRYLAALEAEIAKLAPRAARAGDLERSAGTIRARAALLDSFRRRTQADLNTLQELTRLVAPPGWLQGAQISRTNVVLSGEAEQAAPLLKLLDASPLLRDSEFSQPISRTGSGESFGIRAVREGSRR